MKQHKFDTYEKYLEAQRKLTLKKMTMNRLNFGSTDDIMQLIVKYHPTQIKFGLCHGVRLGMELGIFEGLTNGSKWFGTEIVEEACDGERIVNIDFTDVPNGWEGKFDVVYTNSLDHARDPEKAIRAWLSELVSNGKLYIEWCSYHNKLGNNDNKADCYAASFEEYRELFDKCGTIETVLKRKVLGKKRVVFVVVK